MKILYLCADLGVPVLGRKGASAHVRELAAAFCRGGDRLIVATPMLTKSPWEEPAPLDASLYHVPFAADADSVLLALKTFNEALGVDNSLPGEVRRIVYNNELFKQVKRRFESEPPDFIYERASLYSICGVLLAAELHVPLVLEVNAPLALEQSAYRATGLGQLAEQAERWVLSRADAVLTVSAALRDHVLAYGARADRTHIMPNAVNAALFRPGQPDPRLRARWGLSEAPVLGFVGGLRPWHGVEALPSLLQRLISVHPRLRLLLVGEGPLRERLEREFEDRQITQHVVFTGAQPHQEIAAFIRLFDVALAPYSRLDHAFYFSPLKLFEYMACGIPVVAANLGQIAEVIRDGETGVLYPPGDLDALTQACERLLSSAAMRSRLGEAAAHEIRARYTWEHNAGRVIELVRPLISARGRGE